MYRVACSSPIQKLFSVFKTHIYIYIYTTFASKPKWNFLNINVECTISIKGKKGGGEEKKKVIALLFALIFKSV